jgi:HAD superfamily hydrolase (TIGR01509 family)
MMHWVLFDWGDTLMRTFAQPGPMCTWPEVEALRGATELLQSLHGRVGIALATNAADSREEEIRRALERAGLASWVDRIFCFHSVGHKKASPPFFAHVTAQLDLPADRLVMVGDDFEQDVQAASAAGIKAVWFNDRDHESRFGAGFRTIHALAELPKLLEDWGVLVPGKP